MQACKSRGSTETYPGATKVKVGTGPSRGEIPALWVGRTATPFRPVRPVERRKSKHAKTRKMVNYARAGGSQRKLWWMSAAVLTCKSIVRPEYRGERLIEPSSSWFLPKFPSG